MLHRKALAVTILIALVVPCGELDAGDYTIVDTGQTSSYDATGNIVTPAPGTAYYGQDAQHTGNAPSYTTSADGLSVLDNVTGMTWRQSGDLTGDGVIDINDKLSLDNAVAYADTLNAANYGGFNDWRVPTIKDLYSLMNFNGVGATSAAESTPFIDTDYFDFAYGDESAGERFIDSQWVTTTQYVSTTMNGDATVFGVNFADGRIKGYGLTDPDPLSNAGKTFYVRYVRGNTGYGVNNFADNTDGTVTDHATDLMWAQSDSGVGMDWETALAWVQQKNAENYLGHDDWRLPDAKELQSILDYTRSPDTTNSAAIDSVFSTTAITNEGGVTDYPFYWTNTTHLDGPADTQGSSAVYFAFGEALGYMQMPPDSGQYQLLDVHGAGAQRSDPKSGNAADWPYGHGPQGDVIRIDNFARLVRDADTSAMIGDLDGDGFVGIEDLSLILGNWNTTVTALDLLAGDVTGDGYVGIEDLNEVLGNWNVGTPPVSGITALVPAPASVALMTAALIALSAHRYRSGR